MVFMVIVSAGLCGVPSGGQVYYWSGPVIFGWYVGMSDVLSVVLEAWLILLSISSNLSSGITVTCHCEAYFAEAIPSFGGSSGPKPGDSFAALGMTCPTF